MLNRPIPSGGWVATHEDITERQRAEKKIAHMARHDALTDLANRVLFKEKMDEAMARLASTGAEFCVFVFDLDLFKAVNDSLGHPIGATGVRIMTTLTHEMRRRGVRYGLETMCIGGGQGMAAIFERA